MASEVIKVEGDKFGFIQYNVFKYKGAWYYESYVRMLRVQTCINRHPRDGVKGFDSELSAEKAVVRSVKSYLSQYDLRVSDLDLYNKFVKKQKSVCLSLVITEQERFNKIAPAVCSVLAHL